MQEIKVWTGKRKHTYHGTESDTVQSKNFSTYRPQSFISTQEIRHQIYTLVKENTRGCKLYLGTLFILINANTRLKAARMLNASVAAPYLHKSSQPEPAFPEDS